MRELEFSNIITDDHSLATTGALEFKEYDSAKCFLLLSMLEFPDRKICRGGASGEEPAEMACASSYLILSTSTVYEAARNTS